ncbi:ATP-binding cassette domain-containing protein [Micrococcus lylae]|uniref:ATP-binding cassette domain-containing protein n=1 Tax=Micrococcus lylae TaxID=1273 RepID=A0ABY2K4M6_9MICC|nr:ATP-binding cassette domain-containing protein [Micrococcus lylae]TFI00226.1 ATP-binding cassette domain-containing protein [Micrococcus lylae]
MSRPDDGRAPRSSGPLPRDSASRRLLVPLLGCAVLRAGGWILLAEALTRLLTGLAAALPVPDASDLLDLLLRPPAPAGPVEADQVGLALLLGAAGTLLRAAAEAIAPALGRRTSLQVQADLRRALLRRRLDEADALGEDMGPDAVVATRGLEGLDDYHARVLPALAAAAVVPPALIGWALLRDPLSALLLLLTLPLVPLFMVLIGRHTAERIADSAAGLARLSSQLAELARGLPVLVGLHRAGVQRRSLERVSERHRAATMGTLRTAFVSGLALELIASLSVAVVAVVIGVRLVSGSLGLAEGLVVLVMAAEVYLPLRDLGAAFHATEDAEAARDRIDARLHEPLRVPALDRLRGADDAGEDPAQPVLALDGLRIAYGAGPWVVDGLDLSVPAGEARVLSTGSGTGKSTVLHLLAGLLRDDDVRVAGTVRAPEPGRVLWLGQHPEFAAPTGAEELALAGADPVQARSALEAVGLRADLAERPVDDLSPGERRRLALARLLARLAQTGDDDADGAPRLVLLDEPTAHLDETAADRVRRLLLTIRTDRVPGMSLPPVALLIASHDPALAGSGRPPTAAVADAGIDAAVTGPPVASTAQRVPRGRHVLRLLPWGARRLWAAVGWAVGTHLSAALLAGLSGWLIVMAAYQPPILYLLAVIVLVRAFGVSRGVCRYLERLSAHDAVLAWAGRLRLRIWDRLGADPAAFRRLSRADGALSALVADVDALRDAVPRVLVPVPAALLAWAVTAAIVSVLAPGPAAAALPVAAAGLVLVPAAVLLVDRAASGAAATRRSALLGHVTRLLQAAADLHANGLAERALQRLDRTAEQLDAPARRASRAAGLGAALAVAASSASALAAAQAALDTGTAAPAAALAVLIALSWAEPLAALGTAAAQLPVLRDRGRAVAPLLAGPEPTGSGRPTSAAEADTVVETLLLEDAAAWHPGAQEPVWTGLDLRARRGERIGVVGPSGSGKSTLLSVLLGLLPPAQGRYALLTAAESEEVESKEAGPELGPGTAPVCRPGADAAGTGRRAEAGTRPSADRLRRVAWTPQDALVFDSTVRGNLALSRDPQQAPDEEELTDALRRVGLDGWLAAQPDGLDTRVGPGGRRLSGGQRQRLAVARALLAGADVVLLDEPTAHLGRDEGHALMQDLVAGLGERITVTVTHDEALVADADVVLRLGAEHGHRRR